MAGSWSLREVKRRERRAPTLAHALQALFNGRMLLLLGMLILLTSSP